MNKFNNQEIIDQHLPDRLDPQFYEMLTPSTEANTTDMNIIKRISAYLRNEQGQRMYSGNKITGFIVTREPRPGFESGIIHFWVEGVYALAAHWVKSSGEAISREQGKG